MMTGMVTLDQLMSGMSGSAEDREEEIKNRFSETQVRQMLADSLALLDTKHTFKRGDIVRTKRGLHDGRRGCCGGVMVFLSYEIPKMDIDPYDPGRPIGLTDPDCVCGEILPTGAMAEYVMCSRYLEPADK